MTHGAQSPSLIEPRAREMVPEIFEHNPHLDRHRDHQAVYAYAVNLARVQRVLGWLGRRADEVFEDVEAGKVHGVYGRLERWERMAREAERELGISPMARSKLGIREKREAALEEHMRERYGSVEEEST